jgi:membrane-associated phospholipid phosphatase
MWSVASAVARHRDGLMQLALAGLAALVYFGVRNLTVGSAAEAYANADRVMHFEETAHLAWEASLQAAVVGFDLVVDLVNWIYIWGHWPVIIAVAVLLFQHRRDRYLLLRNAVFVSGAIGFLFFALFPLAPPRLADPALTDTVTEQSQSYRALQPPGLTNQFAAFPSLHFGWNLLAGIAVWGATRNIGLRFLSVAGPAAMAAAVVLTANHYIVDVIGGLVVVLVALAVLRVAGRLRVHSKADVLSDSASGRERSGSPPGSRRSWYRARRGRRTPVARPPRGAPPEDPGADTDLLGSAAGGEPVRASPHAPVAARRARPEHRAAPRPEGR